MKNLNHKLIGLVLSLMTLGSLTACNTMKGAGEDMERAGEKIQEKAEEAKN